MTEIFELNMAEERAIVIGLGMTESIGLNMTELQNKRKRLALPFKYCYIDYLKTYNLTPDELLTRTGTKCRGSCRT